nr:MAG TPA: chitin synthase regulator [Caudoviricetes sp.]
MNIESLNSWSEALLIVTTILGIMALIWIGLCLINQKRNRRW